MTEEEIEEALIEAAGEDFVRGFRAGWEASGEGWNGEYPDEGVPWEKSAGYRSMLNAILREVMRPIEYREGER